MQRSRPERLASSMHQHCRGKYHKVASVAGGVTAITDGICSALAGGVTNQIKIFANDTDYKSHYSYTPIEKGVTPGCIGLLITLSTSRSTAKDIIGVNVCRGMAYSRTNGLFIRALSCQTDKTIIELAEAMNEINRA